MDHSSGAAQTYNNDRPNIGFGGLASAMKLNQHQMDA